MTHQAYIVTNLFWGRLRERWREKRKVNENQDVCIHSSAHVACDSCLVITSTCRLHVRYVHKTLHGAPLMETVQLVGGDGTTCTYKQA